LLLLTLWLWPGLNPILVMIICMLVMVSAFPYLILGILRYIHQNTFLPYLIFFMYLILPSHCFLFERFIVIIMFIFIFTRLCFLLWTSTPRQCFFSGQSNDGLYVCSILLPRHFLRLIGLFTYLLLLIFFIVDCVILFPVFSIF